MRDVVVIGGGQAGLAIGRHLAGQGRDFTILDAAAEPAAAWRERWDSLRLFTPARYCGLPGAAFPGDPDRHPTRDEVVAFLEDYARDLPVELGSRVERVRAADGGFEVVLADRTVEAEQVVVATGPFQVPRVPALARKLGDGVEQLHSSAYRRPSDLPPGPVLVVGGGNTGCQIAEELADTHEVHLAVGSRQTPLPQTVLGRDVFDVLDRLGLIGMTADSRLGRRLRDRETLVGTSPRRAGKQGVALHGRAIDADASSVGFEGGDRVAPATVIWATGFALDHSWIEAPVFGDGGRLVHHRGMTASPGLFFLGLPWLHNRGSALLGWVRHDAAFLADRIAERARAGQVLSEA